ncbi:MAG: heavy-metal-associated domain-containing protein [Acidobacteria bacterium]|nr:heavy-metal-associated domain-containing protein [Acidobacteriota bacterium]
MARVVTGALLALGVAVGTYVAVRTTQEQPPATVSNAQAKTVTIPIEGMTCAACVASVKKTLKSMDGVTEVEVSLEHRRARVRYLDAQVSPERLVAAINELGYKAGTATEEKPK